MMDTPASRLGEYVDRARRLEPPVRTHADESERRAWRDLRTITQQRDPEHGPLPGDRPRRVRPAAREPGHLTGRRSSLGR
jgi:hypothetical protein